MLNNLILSIDAGTIDWSRAQFALTLTPVNSQNNYAKHSVIN